MRSSLKALTALLLGLASRGIAIPTNSGELEARQSLLHLLAVGTNNEILGPIFANDIGTAIVNPAGPSTESFFIDPTSSSLIVSFPNSPHAVIRFQDSGTQCGLSAPLLFGKPGSDKCSQEPSWSVTSDNEVIVTSVQGLFEVCNRNEIYFANKNTPDPDCIPVRLVTQDWTACQ